MLRPLRPLLVRSSSVAFSTLSFERRTRLSRTSPLLAIRVGDSRTVTMRSCALSLQQRSGVILGGARNDDALGPGLFADPSLFAFEHRFIEIENSLVHYVDEGQGPTIVFLHAAPAWSFMYRKFILGLRDRFRCIAFDFPGFGLSLAPAGFGYALGDQALIVQRFIEALDLRDAVLLVHSSAGPIGLAAAGNLPDRFRGLVITGTFAWSLRKHPLICSVLRLVSSQVVRYIQERTNFMALMVGRFGPRRRRLSKAERACYTRAFPDRASRRRVLDTIGELARNSRFLDGVESKLGRLKGLPALIIYGEHDPARRAGFQARMEDIFAEHQSMVIAGEAHFPQEGAPYEMIAAIDEFLRGLSDRRLVRQ